MYLESMLVYKMTSVGVSEIWLKLETAPDLYAKRSPREKAVSCGVMGFQIHNFQLSPNPFLQTLVITKKVIKDAITVKMTSIPPRKCGFRPANGASSIVRTRATSLLPSTR